MEDFKWIKDISRDRVTVLELLISVRDNTPANFMYKYQERRDLMRDMLSKTENLKKNFDSESFEYHLLDRMSNKISGLLSFISVGSQYLKMSSGTKYYKTPAKKRMRSFKKSTKELIDLCTMTIKI
jgi:hypothetical protein